ncbi:MAG: very short patch repair endonuclease [Bacteroidota bacterium]
MDKLSKEQRKKNMKAVKSKGSKIERTLAQALWKKGARYRKNDNTVYGKPDFTFKGLKIAVFCDSEFWHGKDWKTKKNEHKSNVSFWHQKIERNIERDIEVNEYLQKEGWKVLRFWGKEILKSPDECSEKIINLINERKKT